MLRLALPTGDLRAPVAAALAAAGLPLDEYAAGSRALRITLPSGEAALRVFREKDIPIQIALGNYDLGICSAVWVEELHSRYPQEEVTVLRPLGFGRRKVVVAAPRALVDAGPLTALPGGALRLVSEYPGLAERFARQMRLPRYVVLPVWGAAAAYPPEDADIAVMSVEDEREVIDAGLQPLATIMDAPAWLIASRRGLRERDLGDLLGRLLNLPTAAADSPDPSDPWRRGTAGNALTTAAGGSIWYPRAALVGVTANGHASPSGSDAATAAGARAAIVRLAVPDGHAQRHTVVALRAAGIEFDGYDEKVFARRPRPGPEFAGLEVKVIRPQDMPQQVAIGNFDLAITGRDWLMDHLFQFPSSPVIEAVDLGLSRYGIVAAVSEDVPAETLTGAVAYWRGQGITTIRVASEYPNIADHFARLHQLGRYQIVPVNGASEAFVPEDSEILIEGSETGSSFRANRLKGIERVFESTNCVIRGKGPLDSRREELIGRLLGQLRAAMVTAG